MIPTTALRNDVAGHLTVVRARGVHQQKRMPCRGQYPAPRKKLRASNHDVREGMEDRNLFRARRAEGPPRSSTRPSGHPEFFLTGTHDFADVVLRFHLGINPVHPSGPASSPERVSAT